MQAYALRLLGEVLSDQEREEEATQVLGQALRQFEALNIQPEITATQQLLSKLGDKTKNQIIKIKNMRKKSQHKTKKIGLE